MDAWLIAQCMARLPRMTYFSHPECSLDDFFTGEESRVIGANSRGSRDDSSPTEQGSQLAPHEVRFLRSLRQSLGIRIQPLSVDGRAPGVDFRRYRGRNLPSSSDRRPSATAEEPASSQVLHAIGDHFLSADTSGVPTSSSASPFLASPSRFLAGPASADFQAPRMASAPHVESCRDASEAVQVRGTEGACNSSSRYQCQWEVAKEQSCGEWIEGGSKEIWTHVRTCHGLKGHYSGRCRCKWDGCLEILNVSSLRRHLAKHLDIKWRCSNCDGVFARHDCVRKHIRENKECHGAEAVNAAPSLVPKQASRTSAEQAVTGASRHYSTTSSASEDYSAGSCHRAELQDADTLL